MYQVKFILNHINKCENFQTIKRYFFAYIFMLGFFQAEEPTDSVGTQIFEFLGL